MDKDTKWLIVCSIIIILFTIFGSNFTYFSSLNWQEILNIKTYPKN